MIMMFGYGIDGDEAHLNFGVRRHIPWNYFAFLGGAGYGPHDYREVVHPNGESLYPYRDFTSIVEIWRDRGSLL